MDIFTEELAPNGAKLTCYLQQDSWEMPTAHVRPAMLVLPGGGYVMCSDREAEPIALAYLAEGYNAFVLRYSVDCHDWAKAHQDGTAALRYIRKNAERLCVDPGKVAAIGFSAGKAAHANGNPTSAVPDTRDWIKDSVRFLRRAFGDFPLEGRPQPGTIPPADRFGPDTPIRRLAACPACVDAMEELSPGLMESLRANPMESGMTLRMFAQAGRISDELLTKLTKKLESL